MPITPATDRAALLARAQAALPADLLVIGVDPKPAGFEALAARCASLLA
jgi:hypothetical protein